MAEVGAKINTYLKENGIKQSYLVEQTGLTSDAVSRICKLDRKIECVEYYKICRALNVPFETFMDDEEAM